VKILLTAIVPASYDRLAMQIGLQRIIAVFTAIAVLAVSFNCVCAGMTPATASSPMTCCANHHHGQQCKHQSSRSSPCTEGCDHCTRSAMNDTIANPSQHVSNATLCAFDALATHGDTSNVLILTAIFGLSDTAGLSPPSTASTLLGLHCALII
jgi:hypothetical protein